VAAAEVAEAGAIGVEPGLSAAEKREWLRPQSHAARPAAARVGQRERRGPPCRATTMLGKRRGAFLRGRLGASFVNVVKYRSMCRSGALFGLASTVAHTLPEKRIFNAWSTKRSLFAKPFHGWV